jgi:hypothetical protein
MVVGDGAVQALWTRRARAASVALALAVLGACSGGGGAAGTQSSSNQAAQSSATGASSSSSASTASSSTSTSSGGPLRITTTDPCDLLTQAQADALVGAPTQPLGTQSATLASATDDQMRSLAINAPGSAVTLSICGYGDPSQPDVGVSVSLYTLASGATGTFPAAVYYDDVSSRFGVAAVQHNGNVVSAQLGWTHAVIDATHVVGTAANKNPELCLRAMDQVLTNLR